MRPNFEIERRYRVDKFNYNLFPKKIEMIFIEQGYFDLKNNNGIGMRVRIYDGKKAELTVKIGKGIKRIEENQPISVGYARFLLENVCAFKITKKRYTLHPFVVDFFEGTLRGVIIVEVELKLEDDMVIQPAWVGSWKEVTDTLTTNDLSRLAVKLEKEGVTCPEEVRKAVRKIS